MIVVVVCVIARNNRRDPREQSAKKTRASYVLRARLPDTSWVCRFDKGIRSILSIISVCIASSSGLTSGAIPPPAQEKEFPRDPRVPEEHN